MSARTPRGDACSSAETAELRLLRLEVNESTGVIDLQPPGFLRSSGSRKLHEEQAVYSAAANTGPDSVELPRNTGF